jgi:hypothetical protein
MVPAGPDCSSTIQLTWLDLDTKHFYVVLQVSALVFMFVLIVIQMVQFNLWEHFLNSILYFLDENNRW